MEFPNMNLITDPWIPVHYPNGQHSEISLQTLFSTASHISDLHLSTQERISVLRLLVCITQAALGAPATSNDWPCFASTFEDGISQYLLSPNIYPQFNLFGPGPRFLQCKGSPSDTLYPLCQIGFTFSSGNSPTFLDHYGETPRPYTPSQIALLLLTYQNFFIGGSMGSKIKGNGPALKMLHCFLLGKNLKETILLNCLDTQTIQKSGPFGRPYWEHGDLNQIAKETSENATESYLGRLVPLCCALEVHIDNSSQPSHPEYLIRIDQGLEYPAFPVCREPSSTVLKGKLVQGKAEQRLLRADPNRALWRDLHAISILNQADLSPGFGPPIIQSHLPTLKESSAPIHLWAGELIKAKDAKIIDATESRYLLPIQFFQNETNKSYAQAVDYANRQSQAIYSALKAYGNLLNKDNPPIEDAQQHFWNTLEASRDLLFDPAAPNLNSPWTRAVHAAAFAAYNHSCPRTTPRQIEAHVRSQRFLFVPTIKPVKPVKGSKKSKPSSEPIL